MGTAMPVTRSARPMIPLLAKLIVTGADYPAVCRSARPPAPQPTRIEGVQSNLPPLQALLASDAGRPTVTTRYVETHLPELLQGAPVSTDVAPDLLSAAATPSLTPLSPRACRR